MERKLATIRRVLRVEPIVDASFIEVITVDGWKVVSKKGEFREGDLCVYFEVDSYLPVWNRYEFLRSSSYKEITNPLQGQRSEGYRLRTIKLKKQISQGLVLPLSIFPEIDERNVGIGYDLTTLLNVVLYEPPIPVNLGGEVKGFRPSFIKKTDEDRIQNLVSYFDEHKDTIFEGTEKLDGTSMSVYHNNGLTGVCGRNYEFKDDNNNSICRTSKELNLREVLKDYGRNIVIQGELIGDGIQGNYYQLKGHHFYVFNIFDIDNQRYFHHAERLKILNDFEKVNNIKLLYAPILSMHSALGFYDTIDSLLNFAEGKSELNKDREREGIVFKSVEEPYVSFKVINNRFLLKQKS